MDVQEALKLVDNPFDQKEFEELDEDTFKKEVDDLIEWSKELDYDMYMQNWTELATSSLVTDMERVDENQFLEENNHYETKLKEHLYSFKPEKT